MLRLMFAKNDVETFNGNVLKWEWIGLSGYRSQAKYVEDVVWNGGAK